MNLVKIDDDYYNFEYLRNIHVHSSGSATLYFIEGENIVVDPDQLAAVLGKTNINVIDIADDDLPSIFEADGR